MPLLILVLVLVGGGGGDDVALVGIADFHGPTSCTCRIKRTKQDCSRESKVRQKKSTGSYLSVMSCSVSLSSNVTLLMIYFFILLRKLHIYDI